MVWVFLLVGLIVLVHLVVQFPAFRKAILICVALLGIAGAVGAGWIHYDRAEEEKRAERSRRLGFGWFGVDRRDPRPTWLSELARRYFSLG